MNRKPEGRSTHKATAAKKTRGELTRPELLDDKPRRNLTRVRRRLLLMGLLFAVLLSVGIFSRDRTVFPGLVGLVICAGYGLVTWGDRRAFMQTEGDVLHVRNVLRTVDVRGEDVRRVKYQYNGKMPDMQLVLADGRKPWVPVSRLDKGHTTLFAWLMVHAPQAEWDTKSAHFRDVIDQEGWL